MTDTIYICDELAELHAENNLLKIQNMELLARCDLLAREAVDLRQEIDSALLELAK